MVGSLSKICAYRKYLSDSGEREFQFDFIGENGYHEILLHDTKEKACSLLSLQLVTLS